MEAEINKTTLIAGATPDATRYAYTAAVFLERSQIPFIPISIKKGNVLGKDILPLGDKPAIKGIHTITLYLNARNQQEWEDYFLSLEPQRIIFNPGAENPSFRERAQKLGVECVNGCTLVMVSSGQY